MRTVPALVQRRPLITFFVLAYALTWPVIPLVSVSPILGLPALFGPALAASLILGLLWAGWHLPTFFVPGAPQHGLPFLAFVLFTGAYSVLFAWVFVHTCGSVLIATQLHGAINLSQGFFLGGISPAREYWLLAAVYGVAALALALVFGPNLSRKAGTGPPARSGSNGWHRR